MSRVPTLASIGRQVREVQPVGDLILTPKLARWIDTHDELAFKPEHVAIISDLLMGKHKMDRTGRFGPSGRGACLRQQVFRFLGLQGAVMEGGGMKLIFWDGHNAHMVKQLILLDSGLADDIEVEVSVPRLRSRGLIDAVGTHEEGWRYGVDIKTTSASKTSIRDTQGMMLDWMNSPSYDMPEHWFAQAMIKSVLQVSSYMALTDELGWGLKKFTLLYWIKDAQQKGIPIQEVVVDRYPKAMDLVKAEVDTLNDHVEHEQLPPMLAGCTIGHGKAYEDCAYRAVCPSIVQWPQREVQVMIDLPEGIQV